MPVASVPRFMWAEALALLHRRAAPQPPLVVEKRRPAAAPLLDEGFDARCGAVVSGAGQNLRSKPGARVLVLGSEHLGPVHAGGLELSGPHVMPERRLAHPVEI